MAKETAPEETKIDPTIFTKEDAVKFGEGVKLLLESIKGKTGQAAVIRMKLEACKDLAGVVATAK